MEKYTADLSKIELLVMDLDGVLTNGKLYYGDHGDEIKCFDIQDGFGLAECVRRKIRTAIITGKKSKINRRRARELDITAIYENVRQKDKVLEKLLRKFRVEKDQACYIGDDWLDLPAMELVGFAVAVKNARQEVKDKAHYITDSRGGSGAVREVIDKIFKAKGYI